MMTAIKNRNQQKQLMNIKSVLLFLFTLTGLISTTKAYATTYASDSDLEGFNGSRPGSITFRSGDLSSGDLFTSIFEAVFGSENEVMLIK